MKKLFAMMMSACLMLTTVVGCSSTTTTTTTTSTATTETTQGDSYHIVATNFAVYDWAKTLIEGDDNVTITYLLDSGVDSHSYQPSADDIIEIAGCDMFIYVGGESDTWVDGVLAQAINGDMIVMNLMEILGDGALAEETVEGMEVSDDHDHDHDHDHDDETEEEHVHTEDCDHEDEDDHDHDHDDETESEDDHDHEEDCTDTCCTEDGEEAHSHDDEHIWLSLRNAQVLVTAIADELSAMNPDSADSYAVKLADYLAALVDLDDQYTTAVANATGDTILVADRFPLLYLVNDYGISYYAAFNGCSAETEASFETIVFLANKVDELGLATILTIENVQHQIAQTVSAATQAGGQQILVLDSMQSTTAADIAEGATYLNTMTENLAILTEALG